MTDAELKTVIKSLVEPIAQSLGLSVWGLETGSSGHRQMVRLFLEGPEGVTVGDLARVSRSLSVALEVEDMIPGPFVLEVSSPGLDRQFFSPEQLAGYVGQDLDVVLWPQGSEARGQRVKGRLLAVSGEKFDLAQDGTTDKTVMTCEWAMVKRARLASEPPELAKPVKPKATAKSKAEAKARFQKATDDDDDDGVSASPDKAGQKPKKKSRPSARGKA